MPYYNTSLKETQLYLLDIHIHTDTYTWSGTETGLEGDGVLQERTPVWVSSPLGLEPQCPLQSKILTTLASLEMK